MTNGLARIGAALLAAVLSSVAFGQNAPASDVARLRQVHGQTILSKDLPAASLTFGKDFEYVGGQRVNLYGNADAEQHLFVKAGRDGIVARFYWVQFEHFLPTNSYTYDYSAARSTDIGGLKFVYDVKSWLDYAALQTEDSASDGAAMARMLSQHHLRFPGRAVRVRMFHLPTSDRRTELMIIYGESLPEDLKVPVRKDGVALDEEEPVMAKTFLENARRDLAIHRE